MPKNVTTVTHPDGTVSQSAYTVASIRAVNRPGIARIESEY